MQFLCLCCLCYLCSQMQNTCNCRNCRCSDCRTDCKRYPVKHICRDSRVNSGAVNPTMFISRKSKKTIENKARLSVGKLEFESNTTFVDVIVR